MDQTGLDWLGPQDYFSWELEVQQQEVLHQGNTVLVAQKVTADRQQEALQRQRDKRLNPLCHQTDMSHL